MRWVCAIAMCLAGAAQAEEPIYTSGEGHQYRYSMNDSGAVLTSLYPVARFTGQGANTQIVVKTEIVYLGKSCDAFSEVLGDGTWGWANGGFIVTIGGSDLGFPRQEIFVPDGMECRL